MAAVCANQTYAMKRRTSASDPRAVGRRAVEKSPLRGKATAQAALTDWAYYGIIELLDIVLRQAETWPIINPDDKLDRAIETVSPRPPILKKGENNRLRRFTHGSETWLGFPYLNGP